MSGQPVPSPIPEEQDILIQDLEDLPETGSEPNGEEKSCVCERCDAPVEHGETYCAQCTQQMHRYPFKAGTVVGAALAVLVMLFSVFVLGLNLLIARQVVQGDKALQSGDLKGCYTAYTNSYNVAQKLNDLFFPDSSGSFFSNGSATLQKQIRALYRLNGPYQAGQVIENFFGGNVPASLRDIYTEYSRISDFVQAMQESVSAYKDTLQAGDTGRYDDMVALVDDALQKYPETPAYMAEYYRFSVSYSLADDPERTCAHLDTLVQTAPDSLWLYASEGIRAYNLAGQYTKALALCNRLMQLDASAPSTIAYTMAELRLLKKYDEAINVYDRALALTEPSSEMERQRAIILMLQGDSKTAQDILVAAYSPSAATLEHVATIAVCAHINGDTAVYREYKALLDSYVPYAQVDLFAAGEITLEDIFLSNGGEIQ